MDNRYTYQNNRTNLSNSTYGMSDGMLIKESEEQHEPPGTVEETENKIVITMGLNSSALTKEIADVVTNRLQIEFEKNARDLIMKKNYSYYSGPTRYSDANRSDLKDWVIDVMKEFFQENREAIIQESAKNLAASMMKSKTVREKYMDILGEEMHE